MNEGGELPKGILLENSHLAGSSLLRDHGIPMGITKVVESKVFGRIEIFDETHGFEGYTSKVIPIVSPNDPDKLGALLLPANDDPRTINRFKGSLTVFRDVKPLLAARLLDMSTAESSNWYILEYLKGKPLNDIQLLDFQNKGYPIHRSDDPRVKYVALSVLQSISLGLTRLHDSKLVYGDVFDQNVMINLPEPGQLRKLASARTYDMSNVRAASSSYPLNQDIVELTKLVTDPGLKSMDNFIYRALIGDEIYREVQKFQTELKNGLKDNYNYSSLDTWLTVLKPFYDKAAAEIAAL